MYSSSIIISLEHLMKKNYTLSLEDNLVEQARTLAKDERRSLSNLIETLIEKALTPCQGKCK